MPREPVSAIIDIISNHQLVSAIVAAVVLALLGRAFTLYCDRGDSAKIYDFLLKSKQEMDFTFRSTEAISSATKISEKRVAELCSKHPKIKRNEREKQSWRLIV